MFTAVALLALVGCAAAQDPANGWLSYAKGVSPSGGKITSIEAKWVNLNNPQVTGAFFSPWFGIETSDNLNLFQPVNPWVGNSWEIYNEYFQWQPTHNQNSNAHTVQPGDILYGKVTYDEKTNSYTAVHTDLTDGWSVSTTIPVQQDQNGQSKNYTILYFVFEKEWPCDMYPTDNKVVFYDIKVEYDNKPVKPTWTTSYVDDNCNNRAKILNETAIQITWDSSSKASKPMKYYSQLSHVKASAAKLAPQPLRQSASRSPSAGCSPNPCQSGETCCVTAAGAGCCPSANACCCPDKQHCCESGTKCVCQGSSCTGCSASSGSCDNSAMF